MVSEQMETMEPRQVQPHHILKGMEEQEIECEAVTVDQYGKIVNHSVYRVRQFSEQLGNDVVLEMIAIHGGMFLMGSSKSVGYEDELPAHMVRIAPFLMAKYPVTQDQWNALMGRGLFWRGTGSRRPVNNVSWPQAQSFCERLSKKTGRHYALPSEAQWEYACRAHTMTPFYCGETITTDLANYCGDHTYLLEPKGVYRHGTTEVGSFPPSAFGLYDMLGNVWEWCADTWHDNYVGAWNDDRPWGRGGDQGYRVARGGSWHDTPHLCRSASRLKLVEDEGDDFFGFRVILLLDASSSNGPRYSVAATLLRRLAKIMSSGQSHDGSFSDGRSVSDLNAQASPNLVVGGKGDADDLSVKNP